MIVLCFIFRKTFKKLRIRNDAIIIILRIMWVKIVAIRNIKYGFNHVFQEVK